MRFSKDKDSDGVPFWNKMKSLKYNINKLIYRKKKFLDRNR